jgi:hypothetical protein
MTGISGCFSAFARLQAFTTGKLTESLPESLKNVAIENTSSTTYISSHDKFTTIARRGYRSIAQASPASEFAHFENAPSTIDRHLRAAAPVFRLRPDHDGHGPYRSSTCRVKTLPAVPGPRLR